MRIRSKGICRAEGKVYEKMLVTGLPDEHDLSITVDVAHAGSSLPCQLYEIEPEGDGRTYVAVCDILPVNEGRYQLSEADATGQALVSETHYLNFERAKWASRANYKLRRAMCYGIRSCDDAAPYGRVSLRVLQAIPTPTHIIYRLALSLPAAPTCSVQALCQNERLEVVADKAVPMGLGVTQDNATGAAMCEARFSLRVPWNQGTVYFTAWDEKRTALCATEKLPAERTESLVSQATNDLYNNAGVDPYYPEWFSQHRATPYQLDLQRKARLPIMPTFSLVVPLYRTPDKLFTEMLESVRDQSYQKWELILVNASPESRSLRKLVDKAEKSDARVKVVTLETNRGISENTNAGIAVASGDFVGFFDHDDLIEPDLLFEYAHAINERPDTDVLYCDEDKIDEGGGLSSPFFKGAFSIDELRGYNVVCHLLAIRKELLDTLEPNTAEFDGAQDHNLTLEAVEHARYVNHVPRMLYHWRVTAGSTAADADSKPYAAEAGIRAVSQHLKRMGLRAEVGHARYPFKYTVRYLPPESKPLVSVIIPTSDHVDVLQTCVQSILEKTTYENFEVLLVDNNSVRQETFSYYDQVANESTGRVRVAHYDGPFNFSALVNFGARCARGDYLLLLNNDTEVITPEWMDRMLGICARQDVGAVGVRLLYPDDTIQHAGVVVSGMGAGHLFLNFPRENHGYFNLADCQRNLSAVTAACMMVDREDFESVGGFDEELAVAYNDVDFCLKLRAHNQLVVYTPEVELYHYESLSRGEENNPEKRRRYYREWTTLLHRWSDFYASGDPYYTPQLQPTLPNCCYYRF